MSPHRTTGLTTFSTRPASVTFAPFPAVLARTKPNPTTLAAGPFGSPAHHPAAATVDVVELSTADLFNLAAETPETPMHVGAIVVLDGSLRLPAVRAAIEGGLASTPRLRQVVRRRRWVDDPDFRLDRHVSHVELPPSADVLRLAERLLAPRLDRDHPLWHVWLVTGLPEGRVALVVALHHAIADGHAAIGLITALLGAPVRSGPVGHRGRSSWRGLLSAGGRVSRTSLNRVSGAARRIGVVRLDLAAVKRIAHAHGGKVNDVLLGLVTGGVRSLLLSRGEPVDGVRVRASVAVSRRVGTGLGNQVGSVLVWLPVGAPDPAARLAAVVARTRVAKALSPAGGGLVVQALLVRLGLVRWFIRRQRVISFIESDVVGPAAPIRLLGLPVVDLVPVTPVAGNLTVAFVALSYAGRLVVTVCADAESLPVLTGAMDGEWAALTAGAAH